jgi:hypothetical protein
MGHTPQFIAQAAKNQEAAKLISSWVRVEHIYSTEEYVGRVRISVSASFLVITVILLSFLEFFKFFCFRFNKFIESICIFDVKGLQPRGCISAETQKHLSTRAKVQSN